MTRTQLHTCEIRRVKNHSPPVDEIVPLHTHVYSGGCIQMSNAPRHSNGFHQRHSPYIGQGSTEKSLENIDGTAIHFETRSDGPVLPRSKVPRQIFLKRFVRHPSVEDEKLNKPLSRSTLTVSRTVWRRNFHNLRCATLSLSPRIRKCVTQYLRE